MVSRSKKESNDLGRQLRIMMVIGTRPEVIKMAPLARQIAKFPRELDLFVCATGQHEQLFSQMTSSLRFNVDKNLNLMQPNQKLAFLMSKMLTSLESEMVRYKPDVVLVHGDTTTALSATLAAFYSGVKVGHIEAGLRTFNILAPFPEELNRQLISRVSHFNFAPTESSSKNLQCEGVELSTIYVTGNTIVDALKQILLEIETDKELRLQISNSLSKTIPFDFTKSKFLLVTGHRRENFGAGFENICQALREIAERFSQINIVYPVHLNPNVLNPVHRMLSGIPNVFLINPLNYPEFIWLMKHSMAVLTDSGGVQEEAPTLGVPVFLMRQSTERTEGLVQGSTVLVGSDKERIVQTVSQVVNDIANGKCTEPLANPYGDGFASERIVSILQQWRQSLG